MKIKNLLFISMLSLLLLISCKNSTSSHGNVTADDLIGSWSIFHEIIDLSLTTNVSTDIVNPDLPGTGSLTVNDQSVTLNFVQVTPPTPWLDRLRSDYGVIQVSNHLYYFWDSNLDTWNYSIYINYDYDVTSYLDHTWNASDRDFEAWSGNSPEFNFSTTDFTLTVTDTLIHIDFQIMTEDTAYVAGTVTAAKINIPANHSTQVMEQETFPINSDIITFYDDGTFIEEYFQERVNNGGTWSLENEVLHLTYIWTDWEGNERTEDLFFTTNIDQGQLSLNERGEACDDSDPEYTIEECFSDISYQYWPLEGSDIAGATGGIFYELEKYTPPETSNEISNANALPLSQGTAFVKELFRHDQTTRRQNSKK